MTRNSKQMFLEALHREGVRRLGVEGFETWLDSPLGEGCPTPNSLLNAGMFEVVHWYLEKTVDPNPSEPGFRQLISGPDSDWD